MEPRICKIRTDGQTGEKREGELTSPAPTACLGATTQNVGQRTSPNHARLRSVADRYQTQITCVRPSRHSQLTALCTPTTSRSAARSAESLRVEYSSAACGLSVPPYPSMSGAITRYPARTHGPIWYRQPNLLNGM